MSLLNGVSACDDGTASTLAFRKPFRVRVQNKFLKTPELIHWMGTPTTGNKTLDRQLQENFVEIQATPIACVEYYLMGAPIQFRNAAIPNQILTILRQHVRNWDYIMNTFYNVTPPPLEELDDISEFCELIIKYAGVNARRDGIWTIVGRGHRAAKQNGDASAYAGTEINSRRRYIGGQNTPSDDGIKTGVEARNEKMMNFRKNFAKMKDESK